MASVQSPCQGSVRRVSAGGGPRPPWGSPGRPAKAPGFFDQPRPPRFGPGTGRRRHAARAGATAAPPTPAVRPGAPGPPTGPGARGRPLRDTGGAGPAPGGGGGRPPGAAPPPRTRPPPPRPGGRPPYPAPEPPSGL